MSQGDILNLFTDYEMVLRTDEIIKQLPELSTNSVNAGLRKLKRTGDLIQNFIKHPLSRRGRTSEFRKAENPTPLSYTPILKVPKTVCSMDYIRGSKEIQVEEARMPYKLSKCHKCGKQFIRRMYKNSPQPKYCSRECAGNAKKEGDKK